MVLLFGCEANTSANDQRKSNTKNNFHLLIFKKEQKLEIWKVGFENTFLESFKLKNLQQLPIGQFDLGFDKKNQKLLIHFPNDFYKAKAFKINSNHRLILDRNNLPKRFFKKYELAEASEIIIFPNDNRRGGDLIPCFACPHWMAEIYAFLNLKKKAYF
jgi:hypothetical protein